MPARVLTVEEIMAILPETPSRLADLTDGLTSAQLRFAPEPDAWPVSVILAHLRACSDILGGNMLRILAEDQPTWKAMNPRTWQTRVDYDEWALRDTLEAFTKQRTELLSVLQPLRPEDWERTARVGVPPNKWFDYSTRYYGDWLAGHERAHLKWLPRLIATARESA